VYRLTMIVLTLCPQWSRDRLLAGRDHFNVLPLQSEEALFVGEIQGENSWSSTLPTDGNYTIRVYLVRAEARRGGKADFEYTVSIIK
jgi:hypothetical protein